MGTQCGTCWVPARHRCGHILSGAWECRVLTHVKRFTLYLLFFLIFPVTGISIQTPTSLAVGLHPKYPITSSQSNLIPKQRKSQIPFTYFVSFHPHLHHCYDPMTTLLEAGTTHTVWFAFSQSSSKVKIATEQLAPLTPKPWLPPMEE